MQLEVVSDSGDITYTHEASKRRVTYSHKPNFTLLPAAGCWLLDLQPRTSARGRGRRPGGLNGMVALGGPGTRNGTDGWGVGPGPMVFSDPNPHVEGELILGGALGS